ncbi:hypothetical protein BT63DRAFT_425278 [Microthyrium microscopicum]|uniref:Uncharacterized protein n=1 Tax=Microthyrium microscopicum TaxID=703497 RepID=A0A6A6UBF6_9PEZI|nr:hypothetical protein BT63DRAFT_425278 [Microthyrium microscopicum]
MSRFSLSIHSFTPPTLPAQPDDINPSDFKSAIHSSRTIAAATSPLCFTLSLPSARPNDPLYPATHLQITYNFEGSGEQFIPNPITSRDLIDASTEEEVNLYSVQLSGNDIARSKVNHGMTSNADVSVYAWRREKLLGKWLVGGVEGLGIVGLKSEPIHRLRQKTWAKAKGVELQDSE